MTHPADILAPGKLILIGEYAVRHAGPAVVMAVDREARLSWRDPDVQVEADLALRTAAAQETLLGSRRSAPLDSSARIATPRESLVSFARRESARLLGAAEPGPAARCRVDSSAFYAGADKLGLGSSAAVVTAAVASVFCEAGRDIERPREREQLWHTARQIHDAFQGVAGSGLDLAAAVFGGILAMDPRRPAGRGRFRAWTAPPGLHLVFAWTGQPASTGRLVSAVDRYQRSDPCGHADLMGEMIDLADRFLLAEAGPAERLLPLVRAYGQVMEQLGSRATAPICTPAIGALTDAAERLGGAAKPSGAGGGDFVMAAFCQPRAALAFRAEARTLGARPMDLRPHRRGVHLALPVDSTARCEEAL